jgi:hypothetical protein
VSFQFHSWGRVVGNREVSRFAGRANGAAGEKEARGGNRVSPTGARLSRLTGVEVDA